MNVRNSAQSQLSTHTLNDRMQYKHDMASWILYVRFAAVSAHLVFPDIQIRSVWQTGRPGFFWHISLDRALTGSCQRSGKGRGGCCLSWSCYLRLEPSQPYIPDPSIKQLASFSAHHPFTGKEGEVRYFGIGASISGPVFHLSLRISCLFLFGGQKMPVANLCVYHNRLTGC
jgi:hypothetical protein